METKDYIVTAVIIIVALAAGILSAYQYVDSVKSGKKNEKATEDLLIAQKKIESAQSKSIELNEELNLAYRKINEKADELIVAQKEVNQLQSDIIKKVMGEGFPILNTMADPTDNLSLYILTQSTNPIFDISVNVRDADKLIECLLHEDKDYWYVGKNCYELSLVTNEGPMNLGPNGFSILHGKIRKQERRLMTFISTRNITSVQFSTVRLNENTKEWEHFFRIYEIDKSTNEFKSILYENNSIYHDEYYVKHFKLDKRIFIDTR